MVALSHLLLMDIRFVLAVECEFSGVAGGKVYQFSPTCSATNPLHRDSLLNSNLIISRSILLALSLMHVNLLDTVLYCTVV